MINEDMDIKLRKVKGPRCLSGSKLHQGWAVLAGENLCDNTRRHGGVPRNDQQMQPVWEDNSQGRQSEDAHAHEHFQKYWKNATSVILLLSGELIWGCTWNQYCQGKSWLDIIIVCIKKQVAPIYLMIHLLQARVPLLIYFTVTVMSAGGRVALLNSNRVLNVIQWC